MKASKAILAVVLAGWMAGTARADFIRWDDEQMTVNTAHTQGTLFDQSKVWVVTGGSVNVIDTYNTATVNISGGSVGILTARDGTTVNVTGGSVTQAIYAEDATTVNITGGSIVVVMTENGSADMSGGSVQGFYATNTSTVDISGGLVHQIVTSNESVVDVSGGEILALTVTNNSTVILNGTFHLGDGLSLDGNRIRGTGVLFGEWLDGIRWSMEIRRNDTDATIWVPEPATLSLLALGGLAMIRRRRAR